MPTRFQVLIPIGIAAVIVGVAGIVSLPSEITIDANSNFLIGTVQLDDKKTSQSLGALNRASAPGRKMQKLGFLMLWIPEPTGVTVVAGAPMILAGRYLEKKYNGSTLKDIGQSTHETMSSINQFKASL